MTKCYKAADQAPGTVSPVSDMTLAFVAASPLAVAPRERLRRFRSGPWRAELCLHLRMNFLVVTPGLLVRLAPDKYGCAVKRRAQGSASGLLDDEDASGYDGSAEQEGSRGNSKGNWQVWLVVGAAVVTGFACLVAIRIGIEGTIAAATETAIAAAAAPAVAATEAPALFTWQLFGYKVQLGERTPGWIYFSLLMAAGFGLFVSEEALNVWVGATLGRCLVLGPSREAFFDSLCSNGLYMASTVLWVYWGVCISDMVPFYAGRLAGDKFRDKFGVSQEKVEQVTRRVRRYGNLIGFVERFSLGVRNPTSFLAGATGISPYRYFAGVCAGALITLPLQLSVGVVMREHPIRAIASVASFVGVLSVFPYLAATIASLVYIMRRRMDTWVTRPSP